MRAIHLACRTEQHLVCRREERPFLARAFVIGSPLLGPGLVAVMIGRDPSRGGGTRATLRPPANAFSWRRVLCYSAPLLTVGWAIFSFRSVPKDAKVSPAAFTTREGERNNGDAGVAGVENAGLFPAPWDPEGCQTVVFFHIPKTGGESLNNLWHVRAGTTSPRLFGWAGYRLMRLRNTPLSPRGQEQYLTNM